MTSLVITPTTVTVEGWLILAFLAVGCIFVGSCVGELLRWVREQQTVPVRPTVDEFADAMADEREFMRMARQRIQQKQAEEDRAAEVRE